VGQAVAERRDLGGKAAMSGPDEDSVAANVAQWTETNAEFTDQAAERSWNDPELKWGVFGIPESEVGCLGDVAGLDVVELGCGTAFTSARLARQGARPVGVDPTPAQLETARRMQHRTGIVFPLVESPAESVPLPRASFDLVLSDYGASLWADPFKWIPEAARLLRAGGRLVFLTNSQLAHLTLPDEDVTPGATLQRELFGMWRTKWPAYPGIEYHLSHGEWIRVLRENGFAIDALHELRPGEDAVDHTYYYAHPVEWARRWPAEEVWEAHLR
jgi:ubiquinone/menaquinone biosynthesis C-methylase UbiE